MEAISSALNKQLNLEHFSFYQYLSMSAYVGGKGLKGMSHWLHMQAKEELAHAEKIFDYLMERGVSLEFLPIGSPKQNWDSVLEAFEHALEHEKKITTSINNLVDVAVDKSRHPTNNFLQWFVAEQVSEEAMLDEIIQKLKLIGDDKSALFVLDNELSARKLKQA